MSALSDIVAKFRVGSPNIAKAFDEVERRLVALEQPPPPPPSEYEWPAEIVAPLINPRSHLHTSGTLQLDSGDHVVTLAGTGPCVVQGTGNVHVSGRVNISKTAAANEGARRALILRGFTGTIWVADLLLTGDVVDGKRRAIADGLVVEAPNAQALYVQNVRGEGITAPVPGDWNTAHPDGLFTWAPPRRCYLDRITIETDYQGATLSHVPYLGMPAVSWDVRRLNVRPVGDGPISVWPTDGPHLPYGPDTTYRFDQVFTGAPIKYGLEKAVGTEVVANQDGTNWHLLGQRAGEPAIRSGWQFRHADGSAANMSQSVPGDYVEWANVNGKTGRVTFGDPPGGDYVPAGSVG